MSQVNILEHAMYDEARNWSVPVQKNQERSFLHQLTTISRLHPLLTSLINTFANSSTGRQILSLKTYH